jgi:hypothetical protein
MKRAAILTGIIISLLVPATASGADLVPLGDEGTWSSEPIFVTAPDNDPRAFVVERGSGETNTAAVRVAAGGSVKSAPFLTVANVDLESERGLLSMAFAPDYAASGLFYVFYTADGPDSLDPDGQEGDIRIIEYRRSGTDPDRADPASARLVLRIRHTAGNHNGGWMGFGPDGHLYISIGDNADPSNSQTLTNLLGKILRIDPADPDGPGPLTATVPADNPFVGTPGARGEIWTWGLRNPFRASFAPNGDLTVADVGGGENEEVNAGDLRGKNMGGPECEGFCDSPQPAFTDPVFEYPNSGSPDCAVLGGHVVRDPDLTGLTGRYIYGDLCASDLRTLNLTVPGGDPFPAGLELDGGGSLRSFGEDGRGCSYVVTSSRVYRIAAGPGAGADCPHAVRPDDPPPPGPAPDVTFEFFIPKKRVIARRIVVAGRCSIACDLEAAGRVRISRNRAQRKPQRIRLGRGSVAARAGEKTRLRLKLNPKKLRRVRKAVRRGSRITAFVKVWARAGDGSGGAASKPVRLVRAKRR